MLHSELKNKLIDPKRRANIDGKYAIHRVGRKRWDIISKNMGPELAIWSHLLAFGKNTLQKPPIIDKYCGEENYITIRPKLIAQHIVLQDAKPTKQIKPIKPAKANKKQNKAQLIRQANILKQMEEEMSSLMSMMGNDPIISSDNKPIIFVAKFVEFILIKMMIQCQNLMKKYIELSVQLKKKTTSIYTASVELNELQTLLNLYEKNIIEAIIGYNKIITERRQNSLLARSCLEDLSNLVTNAKKIINFNPEQTILKYPEFIFRTVYDSMLQKKQLNLYPSQKELFEFITTHDKYLALVHTMLGSGKTSMVLPICGWLMQNKSKTKLIFCCPNEIVLLEVAHMIYGMGIAFAVVIYNPSRDSSAYDFPLEYKWSTFADQNKPHESSVLYLCDIFVARIILEKRAQLIKEKMAYLVSHQQFPLQFPLIEKNIPVIPDYILIGDELTKDADSQKRFMVESGFSVTTEIFIDLMKIAPSKIILMSATLPTAEQVPELYQSILATNPGMIQRSFTSMEARIGCALISNSGELYMPHLDSTTVYEIKHILSVIQTNPFIGRFYTFEILLQMVDTFKNIGLDIPDLSIMYNDPTTVNQTNIQKNAYHMLETLIKTNSNEIITNSCKMGTKKDNYLDLSKIFTIDISRFNKGCLIFSSDPVATAMDIYTANFNKFLDPETDRNIFQQVRLDKILAKYHEVVDIYHRELKRISGKLDDGSSKRNKENDTKERPKQQTWQTISQLADEKPTWDFPSALQICSIEHLHKIGCTSIMAWDFFVAPEDFPIDSSVSIEILTMLASGIGIYSVGHPALDDAYLNTVILLAKQGIIKIIFADDSIAYGTNLAVSNIIIIDEPIKLLNSTVIESITEQHSMKTIFQMLGRAGRGANLSYEARIYTTSVNNNLINKIKLYIRGMLNEAEHDEVSNIKKAYKVLW